MAPKMMSTKPKKLGLKSLLQTICISWLVGNVTGTVNHYSNPSEDNVFSPPVCKTNQDGFGGTTGTDVRQIEYFYSIDFVSDPGENIDDVLFILERSIADHLLQTDDFKNIPCRRRRLEAIDTRNLRQNRRNLIAVGLTINPSDQPLDGVECPTTNPGSSCYVISGAFDVYTVGQQNEDLEENILAELKESMNDGTFDDADDSIDQITFLDELPTNTQTGDELNDPGNNEARTVEPAEGNTAVIVGAAVGAIFLIGALAFYRRRNSKEDDDDDEFTQGRSTN